MFSSTTELTLSTDDRRIVTSMIRSRTLSAGLVRRGRIVLALADGASYATICATHGVTDEHIAEWKCRVVEGDVLALGNLHDCWRVRLKGNILLRLVACRPLAAQDSIFSRSASRHLRMDAVRVASHLLRGLPHVGLRIG